MPRRGTRFPFRFRGALSAGANPRAVRNGRRRRVEGILGEAGGGLVKVTINGKHESKRVQIDQSLMGDDKDMLEDLVAAAINDATRKLEQATQAKMSTAMAGIQLPPGMKLPF